MVGGGPVGGPAGAGRRRRRPRAGRRRSGSTARPARCVACDLDGRAAPPGPALDGPAGRSARPTRSARRATRSSATSRAGSRPSGCCPRPSGSSGTSPRSTERAGRIVECTDWMMHRLTGEWTLSLNHVAVKWNYARPDGGWPLGLLRGRRARRPARRSGPSGSCRWPGRRPALPVDAAEDLGLRAGTPGGPGGDRRLPRHARPGGDRRRRRGGDRRLEHLPPGAVAGGRLRLGRGRLLSRRDRRGAVHDRGGPDGDRLDPRLVSPPLRRPRAGRGRAPGRARLSRSSTSRPPPSRRGPRAWSSATTGRGTARPYKNPQARGAIVGLSLAHGPGHVFRALYEATACGTRHILEDAVGARPARSSAIFLGGGGAQVAPLAPDPRRRPQAADPPDPRDRGRAPSARRWPPPSPPGIYRRLRRGRPRDGRHRAGRRARTRPTPASTTTSSAVTFNSISV